MTFSVRPGLGAMGAYQVSGYPWVTGSTIPVNTNYVKVSLPTVSKSFTVINKNASQIWPTGSGLVGSASLCVFFGPEPTGAYPYPQITNNHYVLIPQGENSVTFNVKCKEFFITKLNIAHTGAYQVLAELTAIDSYEMPPLTGSGIDV